MEVGGQHHASLTLPQGRTPLTIKTGGCIGPRASLDDLEKRKISCLCQDSNPKSSSPYPSHYTNCATTVSGLIKLNVLITKAYHCCHIQKRILPSIFLSRLTPIVDIMINVDSDLTDKLVITHSACVKYVRKNGNTMGQYI
jgi:hypothetical protein